MKPKFRFILLVLCCIYTTQSKSQTWQTYKDSALQLFSSGKLREAIPYFEESNRILEKLEGKNGAYAENLEYLGRIYFTNEILRAEPYFLESKNIRERIFTRESREYATSANALGNLYSTLGKYALSEQYHIEAMTIREKVLGKTDQQYGTSLNNLADLYRITGRYDIAEVYGLEAKQIREKKEPVKQSVVYAITLTNLANLYRDMGQYEKAEERYIEAREIRRNFKPVGESDDYMASTSILADLYAFFMGKNSDAEILYLETKLLYKKAERMNEFAQTLNSLSTLYRELNRFNEAESLGLEAKKIWEGIFLPSEPMHPNLAYCYYNLGGLYFVKKRYKEAESYFIKASKIFSTAQPEYIQNSLGLARVYWNIGQVNRAGDLYSKVFSSQYEQLKKIFAFTNESEKNLYLKNINGQGDEFYSYFLSRSDALTSGWAYSNALLNRNLILSSIQELRSSVYMSGDTLLKNKFNKWSQYRQQLASLYLSHEEAQIKQKKILEEKADNIEKELSRNTVFKNSQQSKISWQQVQSSLKPDEAAIEFVEFRFFNGKRWTDSIYYIAILLKKNASAPVLIKLCEKKSLDSLWSSNSASSNITSLYATRGAEGEDENIVSGDPYKLVWKPMEKHLAGIKKIYYSSAGLLNRISFAALPVNKTVLLSDKYSLSEVSTTASLIQRKDVYITTGDKFKLYGGVKYGEGFTYLPGTLEEVKMVEQNARNANFKVAAYYGIEATEESFKIDNDPPAVLHIATHGFFFPPSNLPIKIQSSNAFKRSDNPLLRSGLIFAGANNSGKGNLVPGSEDGILTAYEVSNMYLPKTKLVVLSACETALGDVQGSEGVYGLQRAFKMAGVENLVMSLWQVPDTETAEFMNIFYKNIFLHQSVSNAFYKAQTVMKNKYRKDPYKWAAWILIR